MAKKTGQLGRLLNWLETHPEGITQMEAFTALQCCRISERVRELERLGYLISHTPEKTAGGARVIRYFLIKPLTGFIYNSLRNDPTKWDATPMVDA